MAVQLVMLRRLKLLFGTNSVDKHLGVIQRNGAALKDPTVRWQWRSAI
jgi:hypothetical protein